MWAIQLGLIDTGSSTRSLSVLLSAVEIRTALEIAQLASETIISPRVRAPCILALATIREQRLFGGGDNSRAVTI